MGKLPPCSVLLASVLLVLSSCAPAGKPLVAEVFYDAIGDDTDHEFVELFNPGERPVPLGGLKLESGDGAAPNRWTTRWTGSSGDTIGSRGRFVIGGALVRPAPQSVVGLELQNGPDALRLVWPDGATEVVGWGALVYPEYFCGAPAADVAAGQSLARLPDGSDLGGNALDFRAATPSPGRANQPQRDAELVTGTLALLPERPLPGAAATLACAVRNRGALALPAGELRIAASSSAAGAPLAEVALAGALAAGDSARVALAVALPAGKQWLRVQLTLAGDEARENDADSILVRAGPGPLALTEIQFHPADGEGEWVEALNRSGAPLDPRGFTLSDRGSTVGRVVADAPPLAPDSLVLLVEDRAALLARRPALDAARVWPIAPWPTLNDRDDTTGTADAVVLRESDGTPCDRFDYSAAGVPRGRSLERRADGSWGAGEEPGGTPLAPPRAAPIGALALRAAPRRIASGGTVELSWTLPWASGEVGVELYDLAGRRVAVPVPDAPSGASGSLRWTAQGVAPGLYVLALRARDAAGGDPRAATRPLRIAGRAP